MSNTVSANDMTVGSPARGIIKFAVPLILGYILQQMYLIIDAAIVGRWIGVGALAAVGASSSVMFLVMGFCNGACAGFAIPIAQAFGAKDYSKMRVYVANAIRISVVLAVVVTFLACIFCSRILSLVNTPKDIFSEAYIFLLLQFLAIPFTICYNLFAGFTRALGNSKQPFYFLISSSFVNILLDVLLILVLGMGVAGAGLATLLSQLFASVLCVWYVARHMQLLIPHGEERLYNNKRISILLNNGVPMGLQFSITAIGIIMLQSANNALGTVYVASFTAAVRIKYLFTCVFENIGVAMATYCGQNIGARRLDRVRRGEWAAVRIMLVFFVFSALIIFPFATDMMELFVNGRCDDHAHQLLFLSSSRHAHDLPLQYPGAGLQQPLDALGCDGDDSAQRRELVAGASLRLLRRVLWRPDGVGLCRPLPLPRFLPALQASEESGGVVG